MIPKMIRNLFPSAVSSKRGPPPIPEPDPEVTVAKEKAEASQRRLDRELRMTELLLQTMKRDQDREDEGDGE